MPVFRPNNKFLLMFDILYVFIVLWNFIVIPMHIGFDTAFDFDYKGINKFSSSENFIKTFITIN